MQKTFLSKLTALAILVMLVSGTAILPATAVDARFYYVNEEFQDATYDETALRISKFSDGSGVDYGSAAASASTWYVTHDEETDGNKYFTFHTESTFIDRVAPYIRATGNTPSTERYTVVDFDIMVPEYDDFQYTNRGVFEVKNSLWGRIAYLNFTSGSTGFTISPVVVNDTSTTADRNLNLSSVYMLTQGKWNNIKMIFDLVEYKWQLIINDYLVCTDIPYNKGGYSSGAVSKSDVFALYFYSYYWVAGNKHQYSYDNLKVYGVTEAEVTDMLIDGFNKFIGTDTHGYPDSNLNERRYFPGSARLSGMTNILNIDKNANTGYVTVRAENYEGSTPGSTTAPRRIVDIYSGPGHHFDYGSPSGNPGHFEITITLASASEKYQTANLIVTRKLESKLDDSIKVGKWSIQQASAITSVSAAKSAGTTLYIQSVISNESTETRNIMALFALYYGDGSLYDVVCQSQELLKGDAKAYNLSYSASKVPNIPDGSSVRVLVFDADSFNPIMQTRGIPWTVE